MNWREALISVSFYSNVLGWVGSGRPGLGWLSLSQWEKAAGQAGKNSVHQQLGRLSTSTIFNIEKVSLRTSTIFNIEKGESSYTASNMVGQKYIICDTLLTDYVTNNFHM